MRQQLPSARAPRDVTARASHAPRGSRAPARAAVTLAALAACSGPGDRPVVPTSPSSPRTNVSPSRPEGGPELVIDSASVTPAGGELAPGESLTLRLSVFRSCPRTPSGALCNDAPVPVIWTSGNPASLPVEPDQMGNGVVRGTSLGGVSVTNATVTATPDATPGEVVTVSAEVDGRPLARAVITVIK